MPEEIPFNIRGFTALGAKITIRTGASQANGPCPFCGAEPKFGVKIDNGLFKCFVCQESGNPLKFIRRLWEISATATTDEDRQALAESRGLVSGDTLKSWGVVKSVANNVWLIPAYGADGKLHQLYRWINIKDQKTGKYNYKLLPTPGIWPDGKVHGMFGPIADWVTNGETTLYVCEGPWDAMAFWEAAGQVREDDDGTMIQTTNPDRSLLAGGKVIAVPGCGTFQQDWTSFTSGKRVVLLYDNDHPKRHPTTGVTMLPPSYQGMKRATTVMANGPDGPPETVKLLLWGGPGETHNPSLPSGNDIRDELKTVSTLEEKGAVLAELFKRVHPMPEDWIPGRDRGTVTSGGTTADPIQCTDWKTLVAAWEKGFKWTRNYDVGLSCVLAAAASVRVPGTQVWMKLISPPSGGKTTLIDGLITSTKYAISRSTIRGFHSGYKSDKDGTHDNSLIPLIQDRVLITKDGDTLISSPNLAQIQAEARDLYDTNASVNYRHGLDREYKGVRFVWILCGTESLRDIDRSELGQRFIDCVLMDKISPSLEDDIGWKALDDLEGMRGEEAAEDLAGGDNVHLAHAKRMTGGYLEYLRDGMRELLANLTIPAGVKAKCMHYGKFVSYMRSRPSKRKDSEAATREMSTRLRLQMYKMAMCLAVTLNKTEVDEEVMSRVRQLAVDTSRGKVLTLCSYVHKKGEAGVVWEALKAFADDAEDDAVKTVRHLRKIEVIEKVKVDGRIRWRLTEPVTELMDELYGKPVEDSE